MVCCFGIGSLHFITIERLFLLFLEEYKFNLISNHCIRFRSVGRTCILILITKSAICSSFALFRAKNFHGRQDILQLIKSYVRSLCHSVLVVHGIPGCGKSSLLAKAARETHKWIKS